MNVLLYTNVDYVSYSSYDAQGLNQDEYNSVLDYIESHLPIKSEISGKRVFIGEIGNSLQNSGWNIQNHDLDNRNHFVKPMILGCPFVLYWQMYNNVINRDTKEHEGFWLIDKNNQKQPLYHTFSDFYKNAKKWVAEQNLKNGKLPSQAEYLKWATEFLKHITS